MPIPRVRRSGGLNTGGQVMESFGTRDRSSIARTQNQSAFGTGATLGQMAQMGARDARMRQTNDPNMGGPRIGSGGG